MQNRFPENAQTGVAQGGTCGNDICNQISHTKLHRGFHRAIQMYGRRIDAVFGQIVMHKLVEGGTHPLAFDVVERGDRAVLRSGETERGSSETEVHLLLRISSRVEQQIMAGDTHIDGAHAHVHCDVQWTKVEQFDVVVGLSTTSWRGLLRNVYPASDSMAHAGSESMPLFGTAILSMIPPTSSPRLRRMRPAPRRVFAYRFL